MARARVNTHHFLIISKTMSFNAESFPIVIVKWNDHYDVSEWTDIEGYNPEDYVHVSVGFLVKTTRKHYVIARTITPDGRMDAVMNIIKKNVTQIKTIA